jgi:hypothetical protein
MNIPPMALWQAPADCVPHCLGFSASPHVAKHRRGGYTFGDELPHPCPTLPGVEAYTKSRFIETNKRNILKPENANALKTIKHI